MIFQVFFGFEKLINNLKGGFNVLDPRGADVAQHGHVAVPREPTQTHAGPRGRLGGATSCVGLSVWANGYSGPTMEDRGAYDNMHL